MSTAASKALVREYFDKMASGDPSLPELLADDVTWWVPQSSPLGGLHEGKPAVLAIMAGGLDLYDAATPIRVEVEELVAEGDWVCVQAVIRARTASGEPYLNHYHFAFQVRDGRIAAVREYVDTLYAQRMLFDPREARG